jgi:hypothetical protein
MKKAHLNQILTAAAKLPPVQARALVAAACELSIRAKDAGEQTTEEFLSDAQEIMGAAMILAALQSFESDPG